MTLRPATVAKLSDDAIASDATAAVIIQRGEEVWTYQRPDEDPEALLHTASVTKFVVGLCVASAVYRGHIDSLDDSASRWLTEWADDERCSITLKHLMNHTSGLAVSWPPVNELEVRTEDALVLEPVSPPGKTVAYNNHGAQAVAEVLRRATGRPVDEYAATHLFTPLGIENWAWNRGADGLPFAMSALQLRVRDLARIGELSLADGVWNGARIFDADWAKADRKGGRPFGLLEMLVPEVDVVMDASDSAAISPPLADIVRHLDGLTMPLNGAGSLFAALSDELGPARVREAFAELRRSLPNLRFAAPELQAFGHDGSGGQYLWVVPRAEGVAVRMRGFDEGSATPGVATAFTELALEALLS